MQTRVYLTAPGQRSPISPNREPVNNVSVPMASGLEPAGYQSWTYPRAQPEALLSLLPFTLLFTPGRLCVLDHDTFFTYNMIQ